MARKHPEKFSRCFCLQHMQFLLLAESLDDGNEYHSTYQSDGEATDIETGDATTEAKEAKDPTAKGGTDDSDDDIEEYTLLAICAHEHRGNPTDETTENDIDEKRHRKDVTKLLLVLLIEFDGCFRSGDGFAHDEHLDDAPSDNVVHHHGEDRAPFKDAPLRFRCFEDRNEGRGKRCCDAVDEAGESCSGIGTEELQNEAEGQEDFDET